MSDTINSLKFCTQGPSIHLLYPTGNYYMGSREQGLIMSNLQRVDQETNHRTSNQWFQLNLNSITYSLMQNSTTTKKFYPEKEKHLNNHPVNSQEKKIQANTIHWCCRYHIDCCTIWGVLSITDNTNQWIGTILTNWSLPISMRPWWKKNTPEKKRRMNLLHIYTIRMKKMYFHQTMQHPNNK